MTQTVGISSIGPFRLLETSYLMISFSGDGNLVNVFAGNINRYLLPSV